MLRSYRLPISLDALCAGEDVSWKSREHLAWAPLVTIASEKGQDSKTVLICTQVLSSAGPVDGAFVNKDTAFASSLFL